MKADNVRTLEGIKEFDGEVITENDFESLWESTFVENCENCGESGIYYGHTWYVLYLIDGTEISVYLKTAIGNEGGENNE